MTPVGPCVPCLPRDPRRSLQGISASPLGAGSLAPRVPRPWGFCAWRAAQGRPASASARSCTNAALGPQTHRVWTRLTRPEVSLDTQPVLLSPSQTSSLSACLIHFPKHSVIFTWNMVKISRVGEDKQHERSHGDTVIVGERDGERKQGRAQPRHRCRCDRGLPRWSSGVLNPDSWVRFMPAGCFHPGS